MEGKGRKTCQWSGSSNIFTLQRSRTPKLPQQARCENAALPLSAGAPAVALPLSAGVHAAIRAQAAAEQGAFP